MAAKLGQLEATIHLHDPYRWHYGSDDPVTGVIRLTYQPASSLFKKQADTADLFGPLKIHSILFGNCDIKARRENDLPTLHGIQLLKKPDLVFEGSFKAEVGRSYDFPFSTRFPTGSNMALGPGYNRSLALPPTFYSHFSHYPDVIDVRNNYHLLVDVELPGIDVKLVLPKESTAPLMRFELPRPPTTLIESNKSTSTAAATLQSASLLPEDQRPTGFKQKTKAVFTSKHFPLLVLDVTCTEWRYVHPGQSPTFEVSIRRDDSRSSSPTSPEVILEAFKVELVGYTVVDTRQRWRGKPMCFDTETLQTLACETALPLTFSKANDHSHSVRVGQIALFPSTFKHIKVSRTYQFKVSMQFKIAGESVKVKQEHDVILVPPPLGPMSGESAAGPSSSGPSRRQDEEENLPRYEDAVAS